MILVDTSVWVDHLRRGDPALVALLEDRQVLCHPWIVGELALGTLRDRTSVLARLDDLPATPIATPAEVRALTDAAPLWGSGIGYVDAQLLASTRLAPPARLWTRDGRLRRAAEQLHVSFDPES